ncbi:hypothetical protein F7R14_01295 [Pseudomonas lini]|uniref:Uncharacterized protein n=1 Tax=Pseudomonas lini TaxID=163011 RepID=A0A7V7P8A5_9PSED|nr:hypothetical protein F7R14_01295 [Pseudomonas lini]MDT9677107.1 hypothetical protein [Pseudomonas sp. JV414]
MDVARGLAPVGLRSSPKNLGIPRAMDLRLLRSRTGASPLATTASLPQECHNRCAVQRYSQQASHSG